MDTRSKMIACLMILTIVIAGCQNTTDPAESDQSRGARIEVVTTLFPLYEFAKEVGGDKVEVTLLLPPGAEAHTFEPRPSDIQRIRNADVFLYIGEEMEPWVQDILEGLDTPDLMIIDSSKHVKLLSTGKASLYEWSGIYHLEKGDFRYSIGESDEETMSFGVIKYPNDGPGYEQAIDKYSMMLQTAPIIHDGKVIALEQDAAYVLGLNPAQTEFSLHVEEGSDYLFFTEHDPQELDIRLIDADDNILIAEIKEVLEVHGQYDPHIWTDFENDKRIIAALSLSFALIDPVNKEFYQKNAQDYSAKLASLDRAYRSGLSNCRMRTYINGGHKAFGYMNKQYNLTEIPVYGVSPDSEPTPRKIKEITDIAKENGIRFVFVERLVNPKIGEVIAQDIGGRVLELNAGHNLLKEQLQQGVTFISIMDENLENLRIGLECGLDG